MARKHVHWTKEVTEMFIEEGMLSGIEVEVLMMRLQNKTIKEMSHELNVSTRTIDRILKSLRDDYDDIQKRHPDKFPLSYRSQQEIYMDTH